MDGPFTPPTLEQLSFFLDALNCGALLVDRSAVVVHANPRLCAMLRRPYTLVAGRTLYELYPPDPETIAHLDSALDHFDEARESEFFLPLPDEQRLPVIISARRVTLAPPQGPLRLVTAIDISAQKKAEEECRVQYRVVSQLSDTALNRALDLKQYSEDLEARVRQRTLELHDANMDAIYMLAVAAEAKDQDTGAHVRRIEAYARALAREMSLSDRDAATIGYSAILHDVGKIHIPDEILKKPGPLTGAERAVMEEHTTAGQRILTDKPFFTVARRIARSHHENHDGTGYPDRLGGDEIPIEARIVHLADVYDALTTDRVYKSAWPGYRAASVIEESSGRMFHPDVVAAFRSAYSAGRFAPG